jgi:serine/threonine protein kinase
MLPEMDRTQPTSAQQSAACVACGSPLESERCNQCGAACEVSGYRILSVIAQNPHSRVYLAEDGNGARVALKELIFALAPDVRQIDAFEREARLLEQLSHSGLPRFIRSFTTGKGPHTRFYLAQEFISGRSLAAILGEGRIEEEAAKKLLRQALSILQYLHGRTPPIVHRDIKPANLIVDAAGELHLVDFGSARDVRAAGTHNATLVGTFGYMPPEQLGGTVAPWSDLYALGATIIHALTQTPPSEMLGPNLEIKFQLRVQVSKRFQWFLERLVARNPEHRYRSTAEAVDALNKGGGEELDSSEAILSRPQPAKFTKTETDGKTTIAWSWRSGRWLASLMTTAGLVPFFAMHSWRRDISAFDVALGGFFAALIGKALLSLIKRTSLDISPDALTIRHSPIPWPRDVRLRPLDLKALYCSESSPTSKSFEVMAVTVDGRGVRVVTDLLAKDDAIWIAQELSRAYGIPLRK